MLLVQCDFDDTVTIGNVSTAIRTAFAPADWRTMEDEYVAGVFSVEESNTRQFARMRVSQGALDRFIATRVAVRPGFVKFVGYCRANDIRFVLVSSGLDLYIAPTMRNIGLQSLETHSATATVTPDGIQVAYKDPSGAPIISGFKESYLREFKQSGHTVIYVGDGSSDIAPAAEADFVIARSTLARYCEDNDLPHYSFTTFSDVVEHVEAVRRQIDEGVADSRG